jgi:hypothetical protein
LSGIDARDFRASGSCNGGWFFVQFPELTGRQSHFSLTDADQGSDGIEEFQAGNFIRRPFFPHYFGLQVSERNDPPAYRAHQPDVFNRYLLRMVVDLDSFKGLPATYDEYEDAQYGNTIQEADVSSVLRPDEQRQQRRNKHEAADQQEHSQNALQIVHPQSGRFVPVLDNRRFCHGSSVDDFPSI